MTTVYDVMEHAERLRAAHPDQREGQAAYNALAELEPVCATAVNGTPADPFYQDRRLDDFWVYVEAWLGERS